MYKCSTNRLFCALPLFLGNTLGTIGLFRGILGRIVLSFRLARRAVSRNLRVDYVSSFSRASGMQGGGKLYGDCLVSCRVGGCVFLLFFGSSMAIS